MEAYGQPQVSQQETAGEIHTLTLFFSSSRCLLMLPIGQVRPRDGCQGSELTQSTQVSAWHQAEWGRAERMGGADTKCLTQLPDSYLQP